MMLRPTLMIRRTSPESCALRVPIARTAARWCGTFAALAAVVGTGCSGAAPGPGEREPALSARAWTSGLGPRELRTIAPPDPRISYTGRIDFSDPSRPRFGSSASEVRARFTGSTISVLIQDEFRYGHRNYYDAIVDGGAPRKISPAQDTQEYPVAAGLPPGEHTIVLVKRTEAGIGWGEFLGFRLDGDLLEAPPPSRRRIEFIGDSITAGSGDEAADGSSECQEDGYGQPYENAYLSYGPVLARALGADDVVTAVSGIGVVRNYGHGSDQRTMPQVYDLTFTNLPDSPRWDPSRFVPDALVVALGTNDFSLGDSPRPRMDVDDFVSAYGAFVAHLRAEYPDAVIFCVSSPMLGDDYPTPSDHFATDQRTALTRVVDARRAAGDAAVHAFFVTRQRGGGCGTHPTTAQQAATAGELGAFMKTTLGW